MGDRDREGLHPCREALVRAGLAGLITDSTDSTDFATGALAHLVH